MREYEKRLSGIKISKTTYLKLQLAAAKAKTSIQNYADKILSHYLDNLDGLTFEEYLEHKSNPIGEI